MKRIASLLFLTSAALVAQSNDTPTLQALLEEVRQLRKDLAATNGTAQRVQILLYRLQLQDDAIRTAAQHRDQAAAKVKDAAKGRMEAADELKQLEDLLPSLVNQPQRPAIETQAHALRRRVEMLSREESDLRAAEIAADSDLRREQAKAADLQQRLDQLDRQLQTVSPPRAAQ